MKAKFEYLGEDKEFEGSKFWHVDAIHVTTTGNRRKFTQTELEHSATSLSFREIDINHDEARKLPFPQNCTMEMAFDESKMAVSGRIRISDFMINAQIESGFLTDVSIEQIPTKGESCINLICEQHGVAFVGLALLENGVMPGDNKAKIIKKESITFSNDVKDIMVSDTQRECKECTDFTACHTCAHKMNKEFDDIMEACLADIARDHPEMPQDMRVMSCLEQLNRVNAPAFKSITVQLNEQSDCVEKCLSKKKAAGKTIDDQAIAICLSECGQSKPEMAHYFYRVAKEKWLKQ